MDHPVYYVDHPVYLIFDHNLGQKPITYVFVFLICIFSDEI
jgi:hypothetical protein